MSIERLARTGMAAVVGLVVAGAGSGTASGAVVITPVDAAASTGSAFQNPAGSFDAQPLTVPTAGDTVADFGLAPTYYPQAGRGVYYDFGADYADLTLDGAFVGLKQFGTNAAAITSYFFSSDKDTAFEPGEGDVAAPDLGLFSFTATGSKQWVQTSSGLNTPVAHRYLIIAFGGGSTGNRIQEIVLYGVVPEPASLALLGAGVAVLAAGRRKR